MLHVRTILPGGLLLAALAAPAPSLNKYQPLIDRWAHQDALDPPPAGSLLFLGSSSVRRWEALSRDFAAWDVIQRGFGGSTWTDAIEFVDELALASDPAAIFVYEGSNDITLGRTPQEVFDDYLTFVGLVRAGQNQQKPPIPIVQIALVPAPGLWSTWPQRSQYNALVKAYAEGDPTLFYADVATPILATGAPPSASLFSPDLVHLNEAGYAIWSSVMLPAAASLVPAKSYAPNPLHPPVGRRLLLDLGPSNFADGEPAPSPDPFGSDWNNWFEVAGNSSSTLIPELAGQVFAGEHKANLITVLGEPTGIGLIVTGGFYVDGKQFGGLLAPSVALLGRFAVPEATMDFFYSNGYAAPGGLLLTGLNPDLRYDFRFFGSRASFEDDTAVFAVSGHGPEHTATVQVSGPGLGAGGYNGNDDTVALVAGVRPDSWGQAFVDIRGAGGGQEWAVLNSLEVWVRPPPKRAPFGGGPSSTP